MQPLQKSMHSVPSQSLLSTWSWGNCPPLLPQDLGKWKSYTGVSWHRNLLCTSCVRRTTQQRVVHKSLLSFTAFHETSGKYHENGPCPQSSWHPASSHPALDQRQQIIFNIIKIWQIMTSFSRKEQGLLNFSFRNESGWILSEIWLDKNYCIDPSGKLFYQLSAI